MILSLSVVLLRAGSLLEEEPERSATRQLADELERLPGPTTVERAPGTAPGGARRRAPT